MQEKYVKRCNSRWLSGVIDMSLEWVQQSYQLILRRWKTVEWSA